MTSSYDACNICIAALHCLVRTPRNSWIIHPRTPRYPHLQCPKHGCCNSKENGKHQAKQHPPSSPPRTLAFFSKSLNSSCWCRVVNLLPQVFQSPSPVWKFLVQKPHRVWTFRLAGPVVRKGEGREGLFKGGIHLDGFPENDA